MSRIKGSKVDKRFNLARGSHGTLLTEALPICTPFRSHVHILPSLQEADKRSEAQKVEEFKGN